MEKTRLELIKSMVASNSLNDITWYNHKRLNDMESDIMSLTTERFEILTKLMRATFYTIEISSQSTVISIIRNMLTFRGIDIMGDTRLNIIKYVVEKFFGDRISYDDYECLRDIEGDVNSLSREQFELLNDMMHAIFKVLSAGSGDLINIVCSMVKVLGK